ncbi:hypothetical protein JZ751_007799 [Albula glossodonta]|uniref:Uncharacterized protein n=1 Tax=Albula glossodonta TaxID=121402 RepID=A0A8T2P0M5_9TELE|nr:hypothetical protein JZ751_007799 [Albula glossodonta]
MVNESAQKNQKICDLEQEVTLLRQLIAEQEELSEKLKQELDDLREKTNGDLKCWETEKKATEELKRNYCELEAEVVTLREQVQMQAKESSSNKMAELEKRLADKDSAVGALQKSLEETKNRLEEMESASLQEARRREAERRRELLRTAEEAIALKDAELSNVKYQADKKKWLEEKLLLIRQVKEAEERRNQDMKKYADDRMHHNKLQTEVESLSKQLLEKDNDLLKWRQERDSLVAALEIQMKKLASSNMEKDQKLKELQSQNSNSVPQEMSVLDSSDLSTENGRPSRFPKPELEIQFTPLQPNKMCVKQQGGDTAVTVKITRSGRKRKSAEMEKSPGTLSKRTDHMRHEHSQSSLRSKKDGTLQKIGDFIQSSPTLLGSKAKKIIGFVSAKSPEPEGNTTISLKPKKSKRKLYKTEISSPLDIPSHPIIGLDQEEKERGVTNYLSTLLRMAEVTDAGQLASQPQICGTEMAVHSMNINNEYI